MKMIDTLQNISSKIDTVHIADTVMTMSISPEYDFHTWLNSPNTIIAISAIAISVIGLFLSSYHNRRTFKLTKKHNELSVRPFLHFSGSIDSNVGKITYFLRNKGLGPAIIKSIKYNYKGNYYNNHLDFLKMLKDNFPTQDTIDLQLNYNEQHERTIISSNDSLRLLELNVLPIKYTDPLGDLINEINIEVLYEDIYENIYSN